MRPRRLAGSLRDACPTWLVRRHRFDREYSQILTHPAVEGDSVAVDDRGWLHVAVDVPPELWPTPNKEMQPIALPSNIGGSVLRSEGFRHLRGGKSPLGQDRRWSAQSDVKKYQDLLRPTFAALAARVSRIRAEPEAENRTKPCYGNPAGGRMVDGLRPGSLGNQGLNSTRRLASMRAWHSSRSAAEKLFSWGGHTHSREKKIGRFSRIFSRPCSIEGILTQDMQELTSMRGSVDDLDRAYASANCSKAVFQVEYYARCCLSQCKQNQWSLQDLNL